MVDNGGLDGSKTIAMEPVSPESIDSNQDDVRLLFFRKAG